MPVATVKRKLEVPSDALWKLLADFGDVSWMAPVKQSAVEGSGPGMVRILGEGESAVRERLESIDEAARTLVYTIPGNLPLPVSRYRATIAVADAPRGSELTWSCEFEPRGVSEAQARQAIEGMYGLLIGWLSDHFAGR